MSRAINFIVSSILQNSNAGKQKLGQRIAHHFGLTPGPRGSDDGIDGAATINDQKLHFQCKLKNTKLDREDARSYFSDIVYHKADISIMLSGIGYKETFLERLYGHTPIDSVAIHLLELKDLFEKNEIFLRACSVLPNLRYLDEQIKREIN